MSWAEHGCWICVKGSPRREHPVIGYMLCASCFEKVEQERNQFRKAFIACPFCTRSLRLTGSEDQTAATSQHVGDCYSRFVG